MSHIGSRRVPYIPRNRKHLVAGISFSEKASSMAWPKRRLKNVLLSRFLQCHDPKNSCSMRDIIRCGHITDHTCPTGTSRCTCTSDSQGGESVDKSSIPCSVSVSCSFLPRFYSPYVDRRSRPIVSYFGFSFRRSTRLRV